MFTGDIIVVDKPYEWTSFDVVKKVRNALKKNLPKGLSKKYYKVGHAGTLDPLATGVLILCLGTKTKDIDQIMADEKEYEFTLYLGETTSSFDRETEVIRKESINGIVESSLVEHLKKYKGEIEQVPPSHSAVWVEGKRAYELARAGEDPKLKSRKIQINELELIEFDPPLATLRMVCSKGTYVRSIARDLGNDLGCGATIDKLRRTRSGNYNVIDALSVEEAIERVQEYSEDL